MQYLIPCTENLYIDDNYCVFSSDKITEIIPVSEKEGEIGVYILIQGILRYVELTWLYLYARHQFPENICIDDITFVKIPDFKADFPWRAKFLKEYWYDSTHRIVPSFPNLAASLNGEVIDTYTNTIRNPWKEEYLMVDVFKPTVGKNRHVRVHLLVANAWVLHNQDEIHPICNHIDGNKFNPNYMNLEWVSYEYNAQHAVKNGLQAGTESCKIRNRFTGECYSFDTIKEAARFLNIRPTHLYQNNYLNWFINGIYEFRLNSDNREWLYSDENVIMNESADKTVIKVSDGHKNRIFLGTDILREYYDVDLSKNVSSPKELIEIIRNKFPDLSIKLLDEKRPQTVQVLDTLTNEVFEFPSHAKASEYFGLTKVKTLYALRSNGRYVLHGLRFRRKSNDPWPENSNCYDPVKVVVSDKSTGDKKIFPSLSSVSTKFNIPLKKLKRMIRSPLKRDKFEICEYERFRD